jgi:hypothetical protein
MVRIVLALVALVVLSASPASAQFFFGQGPWNQFAQKPQMQKRVSSYRSNWVPPRNAQCGWYLRRHMGHGDASLNLAQNWARRFPRTSARPGAVVVWTRGGNRGHVAKIVSVQGGCRAVVHDNRGTYARDICRGVIAYVAAG